MRRHICLRRCGLSESKGGKQKVGSRGIETEFEHCCGGKMR